MIWRLTLVLCLVLVSITTVVLFPNGNSGQVSVRSFPNAMEKKIKVPDGNFVTVEFYPDKITRRYAVAEIDQGRQEHFWYRSNGTLAEAKTFFQPIQGKRVLLRHAHLDLRGENYLSDQEFSFEGELTKYTLAVTSSFTFRWFYHPGGALKLFESFEPAQNGWNKIVAEHFNADSTLAETFRRTVKGGFEIVKYSPDKTVIARLINDQQKGSYKEKWFHNDGVSIRRTVDQDSEGTWMHIFRADGVLDQKHRWYGPVMETTVHSTFYDGPNKMRRFMMWDPPKDGKSAVPLRAMAYKNGLPVASIDFDSNTHKLSYVQVALDGKGWSGSDIIYNLREDGFLSKKHHRAPKGATIKLTEYPATDKIALPVKLHDEWLRLPEFDYLPPRVIAYEPGGQ